MSLSRYTIVHICFLTIGTFSQNAMMKRVVGLAPHLVEAGHNVTIVAEYTDENRDYFDVVDNADCVFLPFPDLRTELLRKAQVIRDRTPDVVYACGSGLRNLPALLGKTIVLEHAELFSENHETTFVQRKKSLILEWLSVLTADGLVLASKYLKRVYQNRDLLNRTRQLYLPYGVDLSHSTFSEYNRANGYKSSQAVRVLYMGSLYESYGIFDIVRSVPQVVHEHSSVEYVILGDGPDREAAIELAGSLGVSDHISFEGYVDEDVLDDYLASADAFLAPMFDTVKDKARCPSKIPMYMRYRRPIVTCKIGEVPFYLGDEGFYYSTGDPYSMAHEITRAIKHQALVDYDLKRIGWKHLSDSFRTWLDHDLNLSPSKEEVPA